MDNESENTRKKKQGSPRFPGISLEAAIARAKTVWDKEGKHPARIEALAKAWGYSPQSSSPRTVVAALGYFGLMDAGKAGSGEYQLTERAKQILVGTDAEKKEGIKKAALEPKLYGLLWERFSGDLPSDDNLTSRLILDYDFNRDSTAAFLRDFRATIAFADLDNTDTLVVETGGNDETTESNGRQLAPAAPPATGAASVVHAPIPAVRTQPQGNMIAEISVPLAGNQLTLALVGNDPVTKDDIEDIDSLIGYLKKQLMKKIERETAPPPPPSVAPVREEEWQRFHGPGDRE